MSVLKVIYVISGFLGIILFCYTALKPEEKVDDYYSRRPRVVSTTSSTVRYTPKPENTKKPSSTYSSTYYSKSKSEDPYNAKDYSTEEDFYDEYYDDFEGYEEAADYYDEWAE